MANKIIKLCPSRAIVVDSAALLSVGETGPSSWNLNVYFAGEEDPYSTRLPGIKTRDQAEQLLRRVLTWMIEPDDEHIINLPAWCGAIVNP